MSADFWRLPGPAGYVRGIHHDLVDSCNVVATLTSITPDGVRYELQDAVEKSGIAWNFLYDRPGEDAPANWLARQCGCELPAHATAVDFHTLPAAAGTTFVLELPNIAGTLQCWGKFIERYSQAIRASENVWAPRLLVFWPGSEQLPVTDLRLKIHHWEGSVDSTDIQLYAALLVKRHRINLFSRHLMAALAAKLSGGDPVLCRSLCNCTLSELMTPEPMLKCYALERGWAESTEPSGPDGSLIRTDDCWKVHPALLAIKGRLSELSAMVWSAQVGVLLPLLEERRQEIVANIGDRLHIPQMVPLWQAVKEVSDLEIGAIWYQLHNHQSFIPRNLKQQVNCLKKIRDDLSHRKALSAEFLLDEGTIRSLTKTI